MYPVLLKNAQGTFEHAVDVMHLKIQLQVSLAYLDVTFLFLKSLKAHIEEMWYVLELVKDDDVTNKLKKCEYFPNTTKYLR